MFRRYIKVNLVHCQTLYVVSSVIERDYVELSTEKSLPDSSLTVTFRIRSNTSIGGDDCRGSIRLNRLL